MKTNLLRKSLNLIGQAMFALVGASILIWALLPLAPGDPAERVLQSRGVENPTPREISVVRAELKLDRAWAAQYFEWISKAVCGDFSTSYKNGQPVSAEIAKRFPATAWLAVISLILAIVLALGLSLTSVYFADRGPDRIILLLTQIGAALPSFLLGLLLLQFVVVGFGVGRVISSNSLADVWLPAFCLGTARALDWTQILRAGLLSAMNAPFSFVAEARGATRWRILWRYALPNAFLPFLTVIGVGIGSLFGGAAIIETVFSWNGLGSFAVEAVTARDLPVVQGLVGLAVLIYTAVNFSVDLLSVLVDPRLDEAKIQ